jgi:hypothetical protein
LALANLNRPASQIPIVRVDFLGDVVKGITNPLPKIQLKHCKYTAQAKQYDSFYQLA